MNVLKKRNDEAIQKLLEESGIGFKERCNESETQEFQLLLEEGKSLPDGVYQYENGEGIGFYRLNDMKISEEDIKRFIQLNQLKTLNTIKKCAIFFVVLTGISVFFSLISVISLSSAL